MQQTAIDQKYITFKREAFYQLMGELALPPWEHANGEMCGNDVDCAPIAQRIKERAEETCIKDIIGLRLQDMFTGTALHAYKNAVQNAIEVLEAINAPVPDYLYTVRDYFHDLTCIADDASTKLPD